MKKKKVDVDEQKEGTKKYLKILEAINSSLTRTEAAEKLGVNAKMLNGYINSLRRHNITFRKLSGATNRKVDWTMCQKVSVATLKELGTAAEAAS